MVLIPELANWKGPAFDEEQTQFDPASRIHKHKSTEEENPEKGAGSTLERDSLPSTLDELIRREHSAGHRPLSVRGDADLRPELLDDSGHAVNWRTASYAYRDWLDGYTGDERGALVLEDGDGEKIQRPVSCRFAPDRAKKEYARLHNLNRGLTEEFENPHIAMVTLTCSSRNSRGGLRAPADHLAELDQSRDAVMATLRRRLDSRRYCHAWILEPHKSGYGHRHLVIFVEGAVPRSLFHGLVDSHLNNCPGAGESAHQYDECVDVKPVREDGEDAVNNIAYYLTEYIADSFKEPSEVPEHVEKFNTLLFATEKRRVGYSQNAYEHIERGYQLHTGHEKAEKGETSFSVVGYLDVNGDLHEFDPGGAREQRLVKPEAIAPDLLDPRGDPPPDDPGNVRGEGSHQKAS